MRRGYIVLAIDAFYFGARRLRVEDLTAETVQSEVRDELARAQLAEKGSAEWIDAVNRVCRFYEHLTAKIIFATGSTWPGIHAWDDRRSLDYLLSRGDVDATASTASDFRAADSALRLPLEPIRESRRHASPAG